ncbi:hypothetical protein D3C75_947090 [compost metagenome]
MAATVLVEYITAGKPLLCFRPPLSVKVPMASGELWSISGICSSACWSDLGISSSQSVSGNSAWARVLANSSGARKKARMKMLGNSNELPGILTSIQRFLMNP